MSVNIVCSTSICNEFKKCRHYRHSLGLVSTVEKNGQRMLNEKDRFSYYYTSQYKTTIYAQGSIGDIKFYIDHFVRDDNFGVYVGETFEEFINTFDRDLVKEKGIEFYIGHLLKQAEEAYDEKKRNDELKKIEDKKPADPQKLFANPGNVTYEDLKAYMEQKNQLRYKNLENQ
jgi:hypothetical protein